MAANILRHGATARNGSGWRRQNVPRRTGWPGAEKAHVATCCAAAASKAFRGAVLAKGAVALLRYRGRHQRAAVLGGSVHAGDSKAA